MASSHNGRTKSSPLMINIAVADLLLARVTKLKIETRLQLFKLNEVLEPVLSI